MKTTSAVVVIDLGICEATQLTEYRGYWRHAVHRVDCKHMHIATLLSLLRHEVKSCHHTCVETVTAEAVPVFPGRRRSAQEISACEPRVRGVER